MERVSRITMPIDGHQRLKACRLLGIEPVDEQGNLAEGPYQRQLDEEKLALFSDPSTPLETDLVVMARETMLHVFAFGGGTWYLVESADGEPQAIRDSLGEALHVALVDADAYYDGAATCGHSAGPAYAASKRPFKVRPITAAERDQILDDGTPVLDREP